MRFAKVVDGHLEFAPKVLDTASGNVITNSPEIYAEYGYKPITLTDPPEAVEGYDNVYHWEESESACMQVWEQVEIPTVSTEYEEYYNAVSSEIGGI